MSGALKVWLPSIRAGSGADVYVERLAQGLRAAGHEAVITWFPHRYEFFPDLMSRVRPPDGTDVIHANTGCAFAFRKWGLPLVATEHHYVLDPGYRPYKSVWQEIYHRLWIGPCLRRSYRAADRIITISHFTDRVLHTAFPGLDTVVIPNWLDDSRFVPAAESAAGAAPRPFRLFFVGNASRRKGADAVIALAGLMGASVEILCTSGLRQGGDGLVAENIRVLGRLDEAALIAAYQSCDAVLVPSRYEGFGYAALEAMACARPVLGFRCGAIEEVVEDGVSALLVDIDDVAGLAEHCQRLAADPALAQRLGRAGRERAVAVFSEAAAIASYVDVYRGLLARTQ